MKQLAEFVKYPLEHRFWRIVEYLRTNRELLSSLIRFVRGEAFDLPRELVELELSELKDAARYFEARSAQVEQALFKLRIREQAEQDLIGLGTQPNKKRLKSGMFYKIAAKQVKWMFDLLRITYLPKDSYFWVKIGNNIYTSPRKVDVIVPTSLNPKLVVEIKEYWGEKLGGSKMTNAIYETLCVAHLIKQVEKHGYRIKHLVILDGKRQWEARKSDLGRFLDLLNSGMIDGLLCGSEIREGLIELLEMWSIIKK